jgi:hypothetical protein
MKALEVFFGDNPGNYRYSLSRSNYVLSSVLGFLHILSLNFLISLYELGITFPFYWRTPEIKKHRLNRSKIQTQAVWLWNTCLFLSLFRWGEITPLSPWHKVYIQPLLVSSFLCFILQVPAAIQITVFSSAFRMCFLWI